MGSGGAASLAARCPDARKRRRLPFPLPFVLRATLQWINVWPCVQTPTQLLLFFAGSGCIPMVELLLSEYEGEVNDPALPAVCLDCDPICPLSQCGNGHGVGKETSVMAACLSGQLEMLKYLLAKGGQPGFRNEVRAAGVVCALSSTPCCSFADGSHTVTLCYCAWE